MIHRLRRKFILICALSVLAVLLVIYTVIGVLQITMVNRTLDTLTDTLSAGGGRFSELRDDRMPHPVPGELPPEIQRITPEARFSTRYFTVWLNVDGTVEEINTDFIYSVNRAGAERYAQEAWGREKERGWIDAYRYKMFETRNGSAVVFVDGSANRYGMLQTMVTSGIVLILSGVGVLLLIAVFSKRAMRPIVESYEKQKQFVTDAGHELKTPLTLILTNLDIAEAELGKNEWLSDIRTEGERMSVLVHQLVATSRMEEETPFIFEEKLPLGEIVFHAVAEFETLAERRGIRLSSQIDRGIVCRGNEELLCRLLAILLDNAVKYCDEGGDILVTLERRKHLVLRVENTYSAVDTVDLPRLFDRFYRSDRARTSGGFGMGLSIARSIVTHHHGEITSYRKDSMHIGFCVTLKI